MRRTFTQLMTVLIVVAVSMCFAATAVASDSVSVEVRVILATTDGDDFDAELEELRGQLERGFTDYSSFQLLDTQQRTVERQGSAEFSLPTDDTLTLTYHGRAGIFVKIGLEVGDRLSTTLRARTNRTFFQAGLSHGDGILVIAITLE